MSGLDDLTERLLRALSSVPRKTYRTVHRRRTIAVFETDYEGHRGLFYSSDGDYISSRSPLGRALEREGFTRLDNSGSQMRKHADGTGGAVWHAEQMGAENFNVEDGERVVAMVVSRPLCCDCGDFVPVEFPYAAVRALSLPSVQSEVEGQLGFERVVANSTSMGPAIVDDADSVSGFAAPEAVIEERTPFVNRDTIPDSTAYWDSHADVAYGEIRASGAGHVGVIEAHTGIPGHVIDDVYRHVFQATHTVIWADGSDHQERFEPSGRTAELWVRAVRNEWTDDRTPLMFEDLILHQYAEMQMEGVGLPFRNDQHPGLDAHNAAPRSQDEITSGRYIQRVADTVGQHLSDEGVGGTAASMVLRGAAVVAVTAGVAVEEVEEVIGSISTVVSTTGVRIAEDLASHLPDPVVEAGANAAVEVVEVGTAATATVTGLVGGATTGYELGTAVIGFIAAGAALLGFAPTAHAADTPPAGGTDEGVRTGGYPDSSSSTSPPDGDHRTVDKGPLGDKTPAVDAPAPYHPFTGHQDKSVPGAASYAPGAASHGDKSVPGSGDRLAYIVHAEFLDQHRYGDDVYSSDTTGAHGGVDTRYVGGSLAAVEIHNDGAKVADTHSKADEGSQAGRYLMPDQSLPGMPFVVHPPHDVNLDQKVTHGYQPDFVPVASTVVGIPDTHQGSHTVYPEVHSSLPYLTDDGRHAVIHPDIPQHVQADSPIIHQTSDGVTDTASQGTTSAPVWFIDHPGAGGYFNDGSHDGVHPDATGNGSSAAVSYPGHDRGVDHSGFVDKHLPGSDTYSSQTVDHQDQYGMQLDYQATHPDQGTDNTGVQYGAPADFYSSDHDSGGDHDGGSSA